ncbi:MAG TPA: hypothetical protein VMU87_06390 [Stellaceae bacterium]|nr:hypothetical protein [Stellaceae bacterium]
MAALGLAAAGLASLLAAGARAAPPVFFPIQAPPLPRIATAARARHALLHRGFKDVTALGPVGDYWEANADAHGRPVVVYLFDDGTLRVKNDPKVMVQAGTRSRPEHRAS